MKKAVKTTLAVAAGAVAIAGVVTLPNIVSAWGDNTPGDKGRPSYSLEQVNKGALGNSIVFNSITIADTDYAYYKDAFGKDLPKGTITHEKNFVGARENTGINAGADNVWNGNEITVEDGKEYLVRLYVHNNNPNGWDGVAENTKVAFNVPAQTSELVKQDDGTMKQQVQINGYISSSNATPSEYWDYVNFQSDQAFHLDYVYGSALLENNGKAAGKLSDDIVNAKSGGVLIGYDTLDGRVPGCYGFANFITIKVKAVFDYDFKVEKKVRLTNSADKTWKESVEAKIGDKVDFQIQYRNTSDKNQYGVAIKDTLPANLRLVPDSIKIKNGAHPKGDKVLGDSLFTASLAVGDYAPNANVYLMFTAEVVDDNLACGKNTLINWAQAGVGDTTLQDWARVTLNKECAATTTPGETPTALPTTGPEAIAGGVIAAGATVTAAGYYIASRRQLR